MKTLLKRMHKSVSAKRTEQFMADLGAEAFYNSPNKRKKSSQKAEKDEAEEGRRQRNIVKNRKFDSSNGCTAGLLGEGSTV